MLAVFAALGMVVAAVLVRQAIDDDEAGDDETADGALQIICAADLKPVCDGLEGVDVRYMQASTTAEFIVTGSSQIESTDGWVTTSAWLEVLESRAPEALGDDGELLATSTAIVAVEPDRTNAVSALCQGARLWRCLGDSAGVPWAELGSGGQPGWGPLQTGLPRADDASGLAVLASVAAGYFGSTDFARNDFDATDFGPWLGQLADPSGEGEHDPIHTLATVQGKYTAVGDRAASILERGVDALDPSPAIEISAVFVPLDGDELPNRAPVRDGLEEWGWVAASGPLPAPTLKPGVMAALHSLWTEVTG
jgi:hypothetical protein